MGKNGNLMRQQKNQKEITFTVEQLEAHDRLVIDEYLKRAKAITMQEARRIDKQREEEITEHADRVWFENVHIFLSYFLAVSCRVLVEQFGWKPPNSSRQTVRVTRYGEALVNEVNTVTKVSKQGLRDYAEETNRLYGIEFRPKEK